MRACASDSEDCCVAAAIAMRDSFIVCLCKPYVAAIDVPILSPVDPAVTRSVEIIFPAGTSPVSAGSATACPKPSAAATKLSLLENMSLADLKSCSTNCF